MSDMLDKMKELLEQEGAIPEDPRSPMERGLVAAMDALREILIYAEFGRTEGAKAEAQQALEFIESLKIEFTDGSTNIPAEAEPVEDMRITVVTND